MKYKNKTKDDLYLPEVGLVKAGATVETEQKINNPNFELITVKDPVNTGDNKDVETLKTNNNK